MDNLPPPSVVNLFRSFGLTTPQRRELLAAWRDEPESVEVIAREASDYGRQRGNSGAGLLLARIRRGDHYPSLERDTRPITGWRYTRGTHGETFVHDAQGRDLPPRSYSR